MNIVDKIFIVIALIALWRGYMNGVVVEVSGVIGLLVGAYSAYYLCDDFAPYLNIAGTLGVIIAAILIFVLVVVSIHFIAKMVSGLLKLSGVGIIDGLLGSVVSLFKVAILVAIVYNPIVKFTTKNGWVKESCYTQAQTSSIINKFSNAVLPQFDLLIKEFNK